MVLAKRAPRHEREELGGDREPKVAVLNGRAQSAGAAPGAPPLAFAVMQAGARMHYAVPAMFHSAGILRAFYTDAVGNVGPLRIADRLFPASLRAKSARRLFGRRLPAGLSPELVVSAPVRTIAHSIMSQIAGTRSGIVGRCLGNTISERLSPAPWMRRTIIRERFRGANALYCMSNSDVEVIREARRRGMLVVYEQICSPDIGRTLREENRRFPGFEKPDPEEDVEAGIRADLEAWSLSDLVLAPSNGVRDSMIELGARPDRIAVVPYGLAEDWFETTPTPRPGRVLFVGTAWLLKGSHYLAEAWRILQARGLKAEFRVVGPCREYVSTSPLFAGPEYVGQVPRATVRAEFAQASIFALPTLSEGFGLAHLEAMACGVPVVTTPNCGSIVRDGVDGFIVPSRDAVALADRVERLLSDDSLRERMAHAARENARGYSWVAYARALLDAIARATAQPRT
jgi:glycosyltransferase involved in cell wall biosynthesis